MFIFNYTSEPLNALYVCFSLSPLEGRRDHGVVLLVLVDDILQLMNVGSAHDPILFRDYLCFVTAAENSDEISYPY